jgi:predicted  nucleic acid-binding Zn-ribbon protein
MSEEPPKDLATRAFQMRVLDEFAAVRAEQAAMRSDITELRSDITEMRNDILEIRTQQTAMAKNIGALDHPLTSLEERVDARLKETRPIWEAVQEQLQKLNDKFDILLHEFYEVRAEIKNHGRRISELERRVLS